MSYTPTEWKDRIVEKPRTYTMQQNSDGTVTLVPAPGTIVEEGTPVNANNLNKIEQGIETAFSEISSLNDSKANKKDVENISYDLYSLYLQQYYLGEIANSPDPLGARGIMFDGFMNNNNINLNDTNAVINTSYKKVTPRTTTTTMTPVSVSKWNGGTNDITVSNYGVFCNGMLDDTITYYYSSGGSGTSFSVSETTPKHMSFEFNFGSIKAIKDFKIHGKNYSTSASLVVPTRIEISNDRITWQTISVSNIDHVTLIEGSSTSYGRWSGNIEFSDNAYPVCKYMRIELKFFTTYSSASFRPNEFRFTVIDFLQSTVVSKEKNTTFQVSKAVLYVSASDVSIANNAQISFDGVNFVNGILKESREDILNYDYIEYKVEFEGVGSNIIVKLNMGGGYYSEIKRYGLYCYE